MANTTIKKVNIQLKGYTADEWSAANPILAVREVGILTGVNPMKFKIGDGVTHWNELAFAGGGTGTVDQAVIDAAVAGKVDNTTFTTALATKATASDVTTSLNLKADKTQLATKADVSALATKADITALASKADQTALTAGLATKLDTTTYNTGIAAKADITSVNASLALKADTTAIAAKADQATVTTALALKADKTELTAKANTSDVNTALASKANIADLAAKVDTTTLVSSLATKADVTALNTKADVTSLALKADTTAVTSGLALKVDKTLTVNGKPLSGNITLAKSDVGLSAVDNTADTAKPVSTAQATAIATKIAKTDTTFSYEVDVSGTLSTGKVGELDGSFTATTSNQLTGFLPVTPGQKMRFTFATDAYNTVAPIYGTGVIGYSAADYSTYVSTILSGSTFNGENGTNLTPPIKFIDVERTIPTGVNFIKVPNLISAGLVMKVVTVQKVGTVDQSITQLYDRISTVAKTASDASSSSGSGLFTQELKDKLDSIKMPVVSWDSDGIIFTDRSTGDKYRGYVDLGQWLLEALATSFKSFSYPVGYALDWDKMGDSTYSTVMADSTIITPENGFLPPHLNNGLNTGFSVFTPGAGSLKYDYVEADKICDYAVNKNIKVYANHLTWHADAAIPTHLTALIAANPGNEKAVLTSYLREYIPTVMDHFETKYPGLVTHWNLTNEAVNASKDGGPAGGTIKDSKWKTWFTYDEFLEVTASAAKLSISNAKLMLNDYDLETSNTLQADTYIAAMATLNAKNLVVNGKQVKIDGIGFQFHTVVGQDLNAARTKMKRFADLGYLVAITEMDANLTDANGYTAADAEKQAQFFYDLFLNYERAVPASLRVALMMWTVTDKYYIYNQGKNAPDATTNPITMFPSLYDYYGAKKIAYDRILTLPGRPGNKAQVFQDFIATGAITDLTSPQTYTLGSAPLPWLKEGYTTGVVGTNSIGLRAAQTSQNSYTFLLVDFPNPNKVVTARLASIAASTITRTILVMLRYQGINDYIAIEADNTSQCWIIRKRAASVNSVLLQTDIPIKGTDEVIGTCDGTSITLQINGVTKGTVVESAYATTTKVGFKFRGYDDKFTTWESFSVDKLPA